MLLRLHARGGAGHPLRLLLTSADVSLHVLGTPLSDAVAAEAERVADLLRSDAPRAAKVEAADALIIGFVRAGIDYHFHGPARRFGLNPVLMKVIDVAAGTTLRALQVATRRVLRGLSDAQLAGIAEEIEERVFLVEG